MTPPTSTTTKKPSLPVTTTSEEARALFLRGRDHAHHYEFEASQELLDQALALDPEFLLALLHRAGGTDEVEEARGYIDRADAARPHASEAEARLADAFRAFMLDEDPEGAVRILEPLAAEFQGDPYLAAYIGFRNLGALQRYDEAARWFREAHERDPSFVQAHNWLGYAALRQGKLDEAEARFRRYLELAPDHPRAHDSMGVLAMEHGRPAEAVRWFEAALTVEPRFEEAREHLAEARAADGDA